LNEALRAESHTIANRSTTGKTDWEGVDWIELHLLMSSVWWSAIADCHGVQGGWNWHRAPSIRPAATDPTRV